MSFVVETAVRLFPDTDLKQVKTWLSDNLDLQEDDGYSVAKVGDDTYLFFLSQMDAYTFAEDFAEIAIHFKPVPGYQDGALVDATPNVLRIGLMEPYVRLDITLKGPKEQLVNDTLEMVSPKPARSAYANLLVEMLNNRRMLFIRDDEVEETWRVIDPIARAWADDQIPLRSYAAGTPPEAALEGRI